MQLRWQQSMCTHSTAELCSGTVGRDRRTGTDRKHAGEQINRPIVQSFDKAGEIHIYLRCHVIARQQQLACVFYSLHQFLVLILYSRQFSLGHSPLG